MYYCAYSIHTFCVGKHRNNSLEKRTRLKMFCTKLLEKRMCMSIDKLPIYS